MKELSSNPATTKRKYRKKRGWWKKYSKKKITGLPNDYKCDLHTRTFVICPPKDEEKWKSLCLCLSLIIGVYYQLGIEKRNLYAKKYTKVLDKINSKSSYLQKEAKNLLWTLYEDLSNKYPILLKSNSKDHTLAKLCPLFYNFVKKEFGIKTIFIVHTTNFSSDQICFTFPKKFEESSMSVHLHLWSYRKQTHCVFVKKLKTFGYYKFANSRSCNVCHKTMRSFRNQHKICPKSK